MTKEMISNANDEGLSEALAPSHFELSDEEICATLGIKKPDMNWRDGASCAQLDDPEIFFTGRGAAGIGQVRRICNECPVLEDCRSATLLVDIFTDVRDIHGIFAGLSANQRAQCRTVAINALRRQRKSA